MARVFKFLDVLGWELHTIDDPEDRLPIPQIGQVISIGLSRMQIESVTLNHTASTTRGVYSVRVWQLPQRTPTLLAKPH